jgi:hypothetical protein
MEEMRRRCLVESMEMLRPRRLSSLSLSLSLSLSSRVLVRLSEREERPPMTEERDILPNPGGGDRGLRGLITVVLPLPMLLLLALAEASGGETGGLLLLLLLLTRVEIDPEEDERWRAAMMSCCA